MFRTYLKKEYRYEKNYFVGSCGYLFFPAFSVNTLSYADKDVYYNSRTNPIDLRMAIIRKLSKEKQASESMSMIIIIAVSAVVAICLICAIIIIIRKKKLSEKNKIISEKSTSKANNADMLILNERIEKTKILIDNNIAYNKKLILKDLANPERIFEIILSESGVILGRSSDHSDIVINQDKLISRKHCRIYLDDGKIYIKDLKSKNSTYVNGNKAEDSYELADGDVIKIGRTRIKVFLK